MSERPLTPPIAAPSILSADFARFADALAIVDPARDWVHCDIMDNHFVPNLTFGPLIVKAARALTPAFLDVHLMIERPWDLADAFRTAGADQITVHLEACRDTGAASAALFDAAHVQPGRVRATLDRVRATGARVGLSIKPRTPFQAVVPFLGEIDLLLVMTVEPGFGGQAFMVDMMPKVRAAAEWKRAHGASWLLEVDGGIDPETAPVARAAGAEVFVAGNAVYGQAAPEQALEKLRATMG